MDEVDRAKITSNLSNLILRTEWTDNFESALLKNEVLKAKFLEGIKVGTPKNLRNFLHLITEKNHSRLFQENMMVGQDNFILMFKREVLRHLVDW